MVRVAGDDDDGRSKPRDPNFGKHSSIPRQSLFLLPYHEQHARLPDLRKSLHSSIRQWRHISLKRC